VTIPPHKQPIYREADHTFTFSMPLMSTTLHQGESKVVAVVVKHGDTEANLTFKDSDNASLGEFPGKVTGHPTKGADASNDFKITVAKK
jgi:hypothetical protein